ncbi:hypothetical protein G9A89_005242 [Geosiphon pyriformis]|nr:hypothetical protein G9A89_005242 [Geosiphon pyriformis]
MTSIVDYFDTDYVAVSVSVSLDGLLDVQLDVTAANAIMFSDVFVVAERIMILSANGTFKKKCFKNYDSVFIKLSSKFYKLELLVFRLVKASCLVLSKDFALLLSIWDRLDSNGTAEVKSLFLLGSIFDDIHSGLAKAKKSYCFFKLLEFKHAKESYIKWAITSRIESFELDKGCTIRSVLEHFFCKMVLDHLVVSDELVLKPDLVKFKIDEIMKNWTRKCEMVFDISDDWTHQYQPLEYVFNNAFSNVMCLIGFDNMFVVVLNLFDGKAAGLSGISNELWKHCNNSVLDMFLVFLNLCLISHKILSKDLSDRISLACSTYNILHEDNFFVLRGTTMQSPIFAIGSVKCLRRNLVKIKMCDKFIRFFGSIYNGHVNKVMTDFGLTDGYHVHNGLDQEEVKRQKSVCSYRLNSHFVFKSNQAESQTGLTLFFIADAFIDDTIWIGSSQTTTQYILNIAREFFRFNNISINNNKTVAIFINCWVSNSYLTVSGLPISVAKKGEP